MRNLSQDTRRTVRDSKPVPSKHMPVFVPPQRNYATTEILYFNNFITGLPLFKFRSA